MLTAPLPLGRTFPSGQLCLRLNEVLAKSPVLTGEEEKPGQAARPRVLQRVPGWPSEQPSLGTAGIT